MDNSNLINNTINPVESLARNIVASIKAGNTSNHTKSDTSESWNITNVDDGGKSGLYRLEITNGVNKSGKKYCHHILYRVNPTDKTEKPVNLGIYKKKFIYTIAYNLQSNKVFKKIKQDNNTIKAIAKDMKKNPDNYTKNGDTISGTFNNSKLIINREAHLMKNGKTMYRITATLNDEDYLKGSQLAVLYKQ